MISERREIPPYGLSGGEPGSCGENVLVHRGEETRLPGKFHIAVETGDRLLVSTPGGGGFGRSDRPSSNNRKTGRQEDET